MNQHKRKAARPLGGAVPVRRDRSTSSLLSGIAAKFSNNAVAAASRTGAALSPAPIATGWETVSGLVTERAALRRDDGRLKAVRFLV